MDLTMLLSLIRSRSIRPPRVSAVMVSRDVWDAVRRTMPICRGASLTANGLHVFSSASLAPGLIIPLDEHGEPIMLPKAGPR